MPPSDPAHVRRRVLHLACTIAAAICLLLNGLAVVDRLRPGNQDDKTLHYATSALRPDNVAAVFALGAALPEVLAGCRGPHELQCRERTTTRVASLLNYLAPAATIRLARSFADRSDAPLCERVSLAYTWGLLLLHAVVAICFLLLVATDRTPRQSFSLLALLMVLAAALSAPYLTLPTLSAVDLLPARHPAHTTGSYAPRGALGIVFLLQVAAFASARWRAWVGLTLLGILVHAAQAILFDLVFVAALALRVAIVDEERTRHATLLGFVAAVTLAGLAVAGAVGAGAEQALPQLAALPGVFASSHAAWLAAAGTLLSAAVATRHRPMLAQPLLVLAAFVLVGTALDVGTSALGGDPRSPQAQLFLRFFSASSFVVGMLPWLAATALATWILRATLPRLRLQPTAVAALLVVATAATVLLVDRSAIGAAWQRARWNVAAARDDLCQVATCPAGCTFSSFQAMTPQLEPVFHLQIFDYLQRWQR